MRLPPFLLALLASFAAATAAQAQYGAPFALRDMRPTIEDAAPGQEPAPESKVVPQVYRRQPVFYRSSEAPGTIIIDTPHRFLFSLSDPAQQCRAALRRRRRARRLPVERAAQDHAQGGMAGLDAAGGNDRPAAVSPALHGRRSRQSHGRPRALSRRDDLSHPRHQRAGNDRARRVVGMLPAGQRADHRPLPARAGRHQGDRAAVSGGGACDAARRNFCSIFGDVQTLDEVIASLKRGLEQAAA